MFQLIDKILLQFRSCFKRGATWRWFVVLVLGFMIRSNHKGVTSTISELRLMPRLYHTMLHFYRSEAYEVEDIYTRWTQVVINETTIIRISNRILMVGDHIKVSKEGRRMPDIQILHQESENSGKGEFIAGHTFAQISALITSGNVSRSIPLVAQAQKSPPRIPGTKKPDGDTLVIQMVKLGQEAAKYTGEPVLLALDAYFSKSTAFITAKEKCTDDGKPFVHIVTRAQDSYKGYLPLEPSPPGSKRRPGRPRIYGEEVKLKNLYNDMTTFTETTMTLYGKKTKVNYRCLDLLWKPLQNIIRFVVVDSDRGRCILMSSDVTLTPEEIITIYTLRFKIEIGFDEQKNDIGCFDYHFWTMAMPKRQRRKASVVPVDEKAQKKINSAKKAISSFVCLGVIATGILTIIAFKHDRDIWRRYPGWVRTLRVRIPSVAIVRETLSHDFPGLLHHFSHLPIACVVLPLLRSEEFLYANIDDEISDDVA